MYLRYFKNCFCFRIILDLCESGKDSKEIFCIANSQLSLVLTSHIPMVLNKRITGARDLGMSGGRRA